MPAEERPISELYRLVALEWVDAEAAAHLAEELKTTTLEQWKNELVLENGGDLPDSHAERKVKAQPRWAEYIRKMCADRADANKARAKMKFYEMKFNEWQSREANQRHEARLSR